MSDLVIEAKDLTKHYGDFVAIDKLNFAVKRGEIVGLLGPNGAGKSTTMKILTCFTAPTEGSASINGHDVFEAPIAVREAIGYLPENTPLYTEMMVYEYLEFAADMRGLKGSEAKRQIKRAVEQTSLGDVVGKEIRALSKGYRQRVGLAQALVHEPPLLILDEPMSGLDPNQAIEVRDVIKTVGKERTVILSTHNLPEVQVTCDRVLIIARGKIVADDTPKALSERAGRARFLVTLLDEGDKTQSAFQALEKVGGVDLVRSLESLRGELSFEVIPRTDEDLRPLLFRAIVASGFTLLGLSREGQNLEEIFRQLTVGKA
ncbi:MAG: ABC-type multidrug transport system, ATPase component [Myxococcaceae bacterium]|nr:ABC-type multidrug transport system, ATPase component [Myxococcaceae bacterium]